MNHREPRTMTQLMQSLNDATDGLYLACSRETRLEKLVIGLEEILCKRENELTALKQEISEAPTLETDADGFLHGTWYNVEDNANKTVALLEVKGE